MRSIGILNSEANMFRYLCDYWCVETILLIMLPS